MRGSWPRGYKEFDWRLGQRGRDWAPKWAGTAGLGPLRPSLRPPLLVLHPEPSRVFSLLHVALDINFSAVLMKLLVPQDSAFSVWVLGVFRLHGLVLGLLGVMFTSLLDLYHASRSCHEVLDKLYPEVLLSTLNSCINIKLQNQHAQTNLLYQGG
jgi:hypothetical protein